MLKPKAVKDLTQAQIVRLWMQEYNFVMADETPRDNPGNWPVASFSDGTQFTGDPEGMDDMIRESGDGWIIGTWKDIMDRVSNESALLRKIARAEAEMNVQIQHEKEERERRKQQRQEEESLLSLKSRPWISFVGSKPDEHEDVLVTDGRDVFVAYRDMNTWVYKTFLPHRFVYPDAITHWMPVNRLLVYLPKE